MSKIFSALLLSLLLAPIACDDPDDAPVDATDTDSTTGDDSTGTGTDTDTDTDAAAHTATSGDDDDNHNPGCLGAFQLPPGPSTTLAGGC